MAEGKECHPQDHLHAGLSQRGSLLEESYPSSLSWDLERKTCYDQSIGFQRQSIRLLSSELRLPDREP